jgi:hypothetical protein
MVNKVASLSVSQPVKISAKYNHEPRMLTNIFHCNVPIFLRLMLTWSSHLHTESAVEFGCRGEWLLKSHLQEEPTGPGDTAPSVVSKAPIKMRQSKSRTTSSSSVPSVTMSSGMLPQQLTVYQPLPPQPHQYMVQSELHRIQFLCSAGIM